LTTSFDYAVARVKDIACRSQALKNGKTEVAEVLVDGRPCTPSKRFWVSLQARFGFSNNIFKYFSHQEVFDRISAVAPNDTVRVCIEQPVEGPGTLQAVTSPAAPLIRHADLMELLGRYEAEGVSYSQGVVRSGHSPRTNNPLPIAGDDFADKFVLDTPIDGFGRPCIYLALLRMVCTNGAVAYARAFRSELNLGRGEQGVGYALSRALEGFSNEEGYDALRQRFASAAQSWASVNEVNRLYKTLVRMHHRGQLGSSPVPAAGGDGAQELPELHQTSPVLRSFSQLAGNLSELYGLANLDALSAKRQRTLPTKARVYDLINFASEVATHQASAGGNRMLQAFLGELISTDYDLEGTVDAFADWRDFFVGNAATTDTLAELNRASR